MLFFQTYADFAANNCNNNMTVPLRVTEMVRVARQAVSAIEHPLDTSRQELVVVTSGCLHVTHVGLDLG